MGAGIAASPHCAERRICRCSSTLVPLPKTVRDPASRSWLTSSGVAFHRTAPSCEEPDRSTRLRGPKVRWSFDLSGPASGTEVPRSQNRPVFRGPSWVNHSCVPLCSPDPRGTREPRRARGRSTLPAPLPGWPEMNPKALPNPAGGDRTFGHLPLPILPLPAPERGRDRRPDHLLTMHISSELQKQKMRV